MADQAQRTIFAADVHLEPGGGPRTEAFVAFLAGFCRPGDAVYVLGDLFELWLGRGHEMQADYAAALVAMTQATARGVQLSILPGNRDFLMGAELELACGVRILPEQADLDLSGERWLACHGDEFCTSDRRYQRLRRVLRSWPVQLAARLLPMAIRRYLAAPIRRGSARHTSCKADDVMGMAEAALERRIGEGYRGIICGHVHRRQERAVGSGRLFVLDCWETAPEVLIHQDGNWQWACVPGEAEQ